MDLFLNELSINTPADSVLEAKRRLNVFAELVKILPKTVNGIRTPANFYNIELGPNFRFSTWLSNLKSDDSELKSLITSKVSLSPYFEDILNNSSGNQLAEFSHKGSNCIGLGLSSHLMFDTIAISLDDQNWLDGSVTIQTTVYDGEEIETDDTDVRNASIPSHLSLHRSLIENSVRLTIKSGRELWAKRTELFPKLIFCESVKNQIRDITESNMEFTPIVKRLIELNRFCDNWKENTPFDISKFESKVTPESATRLIKFAPQLTKLCPDGKTRLFSYHARFTPGAGRIHFYEVNDTRSLIIGSIANQNTIK